EFGGHGRDGRVEIIYTVCMRRDIERAISEVERWDPQAFITVEEPRDIRWGWMQTSPRNRLVVSAGMQEMMKTMSERMKRADRTPCRKRHARSAAPPSDTTD